MPNTLKVLEHGLSERYAVERELGAGGMAIVYLARDLRHRRRVAIKVLRPELAAMLGPERFAREIVIAAQLTHPHILPLHDSGEIGGLVYYVMPYIEGESLRERLRREGALPVAEGLRIARGVADALAYAHDHGIVHRDIKPENILLAGGGHAMVTDFGIAKAVIETGGATSLTAPGFALGTAAYMAPEQAAGDPATDHHADLYALGVVIFEILSGTPPFVGANRQQVLASHLNRDPPPLAQLRPSVPNAIADVVMRCLAKHPADRWQRADEVVARLDAGLAPSVTSGGEHAHSIPIERVFPLREALCRRLNRATLDPRIIGDALRFLDNQVESEVLVCYLHPLGLDSGSFVPALSSSRWRGLAPTLYGFDPCARPRPRLPWEDHLTILRAWLAAEVAQLKPSIVILVGHSSGADLVLQLQGADPDEGVTVDGLIALDPNLSLETCFVSRVLAQLSPGDPGRVLNDLSSFANQARTLDEWVNIHDYLVKVLRKFGADLEALTAHAADVIRPFAVRGDDAFADLYRAATARVACVRCVFSEMVVYDHALKRLKLENLDSGILGEHHAEDALVVEAGADHFDLIEPVRLHRHVEEILERLRRSEPRA